MLSVIVFAVTVLSFTFNFALMTMFAIRRVIDNDHAAQMRPRTSVAVSKLQLDAFSYITAYLMSPEDDTDQFGNTKAHSEVLKQNDLGQLDKLLAETPHYLFMLNTS